MRVAISRNISCRNGFHVVVVRSQVETKLSFISQQMEPFDRLCICISYLINLEVLQMRSSFYPFAQTLSS